MVGESGQGWCGCLERVATGSAWELPTLFVLVGRATPLPDHGKTDYKAMSLLTAINSEVGAGEFLGCKGVGRVWRGVRGRC